MALVPTGATLTGVAGPPAIGPEVTTTTARDGPTMGRVSSTYTGTAARPSTTTASPVSTTPSAPAIRPRSLPHPPGWAHAAGPGIAQSPRAAQAGRERAEIPHPLHRTA